MIFVENVYLVWEQDMLQFKQIIDSNRNSTSGILHDHNKVLSIINATRYKMRENLEAF